MAKETKLLNQAQTPKLAKYETKSIKNLETKQLTASKSRNKKIKHSYQVKDAENAILLKLTLLVDFTKSMTMMPLPEECFYYSHC